MNTATSQRVSMHPLRDQSWIRTFPDVISQGRHIFQYSGNSGTESPARRKCVELTHELVSTVEPSMAFISEIQLSRTRQHPGTTQGRGCEGEGQERWLNRDPRRPVLRHVLHDHVRRGPLLAPVPLPSTRPSSSLSFGFQRAPTAPPAFGAGARRAALLGGLSRKRRSLLSSSFLLASTYSSSFSLSLALQKRLLEEKGEGHLVDATVRGRQPPARGKSTRPPEDVSLVAVAHSTPRTPLPL